MSPVRATWWGASAVTSLPLKTTLPLSACRWPEMMLTSVDFPAPFGPMSPVMLPRSISSVASTTAFTPPKERLTASQLKIVSLMCGSHVHARWLIVQWGATRRSDDARRCPLPSRLWLGNETSWSEPQESDECNTVEDPLN